MEFEWDKHNVAHIARHDVTPDEAEQALTNQPMFIETLIDELSGELRTIEVGPANKDRLLVVAWTMRRERHRVVTAFDADKRTRTLYRTQFSGEII